MTARSITARINRIDRLVEAVSRLEAALEQVWEAHGAAGQRGASGAHYSSGSRPSGEPPRRCNHPEGHELNLTPGEALAIETFRECPCCGTQLWITIPSVGAVLDAATDRGCSVPGLNVELTRRERQVLNALHQSPYALRHAQLAALVWSDAHRTNDVRSVLHQLRRKLRNSGWAIPLPPSGEGVRLVADVDGHQPPESVGNQPDMESEIIRRTAR